MAWHGGLLSIYVEKCAANTHSHVNAQAKDELRAECESAA